MVKALSDVSYIQKEAAAAKQDVSGGLWTLAEKMPVVGGDVKTARTAIRYHRMTSRRPRCPSWARSSPH